jgi:hypothetical protein
MRSYRKATAWLLVVVVASLAPTACVTDAAAENHQPAILPIDAQTASDQGVNKWLRPARISVVGESTAAQREYVAQQVSWFSAITNHDLAMAKGPRGNINFVFGEEMPEMALAHHSDVLAPLYSGDEAMATDLRDDKIRLCIAKRGMSADNPHEIVYAAGLVPTELNQEEFEQCIVRQLLTALGSNISGIGPVKSPANPGKYGNYTSFIEVVMMSVWYDPRVKPGMTDEEVQPIISDMFQRLIEKQQN